MRYCVKCFSNDTEYISLVVDSDSLYEIIEHFAPQYKVKAFILSDNEEN